MTQNHVTRLKQARREACVSQAALASVAQVHENTIGLIERGEMSPTLAIAVKVRDALESLTGKKYDLEYLFGQTEG